MALLPAKQKAGELMDFYFQKVRKHCIEKPSGSFMQLAYELTEKYCDEMIAFIDHEMQGWMDWDMKSYFEEVKNHAKELLQKN